MPESSSTPKGKKGKKGKLPTWSYFAIAGGAGVVYYLYKQHQSNAATASTGSASAPTSSIDPLTGQPYAAGVGSLAANSGTSTSGSSTDPFQAIDPSTGVTYAQDISNLIAQGVSTSQAVSQVQSSMGGLQNQVGGLGNQVGGLSGQVGGLGTEVGTIQTEIGTLLGQQTSSPTTGSGNAALDAWRLAKAKTIAAAEHISVAQAGQALSQYLQGKPITNAAAARGIGNVVKNSGPPPTATGHSLPIRVAKGTHRGAAPRQPVTHYRTPGYDPVRPRG